MSASAPGFDSMKAQVEQRRLGDYAHYVAPLSQLLADLEAEIGMPMPREDLRIRSIERADQGVHPEEATLLYAIVRCLKLTRVIETGTFRGYSTNEIARGLEENGEGVVTTIDVGSDTGDLVRPELAHRVRFVRGVAAVAFAAEQEADLIGGQMFFHDSLHSYENALCEFATFAPLLAPSALVLAHDAKMDFLPTYGVGRAVREFAAIVGVPVAILDTTCGLAVVKLPPAIEPTALVRLRERVAQLRRPRSLVRRVADRVRRIVR
jgi:predicted O-methyltransferase YrrM